MHPLIKDTIVLYDVLHAGKYLWGTSVQERYALLCSLCGEPAQGAKDFAISLSPHLMLAGSYNGSFRERFQDFIEMPTIEGLVLKEFSARLYDWGDKPYEVKWQVRCRKPGVSYLF
jgi:ATP-dependent DNA ligase